MLDQLNIVKVRGFETYSSGKMKSIENLIYHSIADPRKGEHKFDIQNIFALFHEYRVSCHFVIARTGIIYQLIDPTHVAWHAGKSEYNGISGLNKNSIGIEFIGDKNTPFENQQYNSGINLTVALCRNFDIKTENIKGHQIVSDSDVRSDPKPDPGRYFDWMRVGYGVIERLHAEVQI